MYVSITGSKNNQDVYIKYSYRKENGKTSSRIYKKLGKLNVLILSIMVYTFNSYKEDGYAAIGRAA